MNSTTFWPVVVFIPGFFVFYLAWVVLSRAIETHLRKVHPVWAGSLFPRARGLHVSSKDEEAVDAADADWRVRLHAFVASGAARNLSDARLDRLLAIRRFMSWAMYACLAVFFTTSAVLMLAS